MLLTPEREMWSYRHSDRSHFLGLGRCPDGLSRWRHLPERARCSMVCLNQVKLFPDWIQTESPPQGHGELFHSNSDESPKQRFSFRTIFLLYKYSPDDPRRGERTTFLQKCLLVGSFTLTVELILNSLKQIFFLTWLLLLDIFSGLCSLRNRPISQAENAQGLYTCQKHVFCSMTVTVSLKFMPACQKTSKGFRSADINWSTRIWKHAISP